MNDLVQAHKFCFKCGGALEYPMDNLLVCTKCSSKRYINPSPCVVCVVRNSNNEILLTQRKLEPFINTWDLPGGFVNLGETAEEAVEREIYEELNIQVSKAKLQYRGSYADRYLYDNVNYFTLSTVFDFEIPDSEIKQLKAQDDVKALAFFSIDQLPLEKIGFASVKQILQNYKSMLRS